VAARSGIWTRTDVNFVLRGNPAHIESGIGCSHILLGEGREVFNLEQFRSEHFITVVPVEIVGGMQLL
jgi:hypothetical protein